MKEVFLCSEHGCCPSVEILDESVVIGEETFVELNRDQWNDLVAKIESGVLGKI